MVALTGTMTAEKRSLELKVLSLELKVLDKLINNSN